MGRDRGVGERRGGGFFRTLGEGEKKEVREKLFVTAIAKPNEFPGALRNLREENHLTQQQLAFLLGVTQQTISAMERNLCNPTLGLLLDMAKVLHCSFTIE